jgi:hypothetical protein
MRIVFNTPTAPVRRTTRRLTKRRASTLLFLLHAFGEEA